jgi:hypothetical protein
MGKGVGTIGYRMSQGACRTFGCNGAFIALGSSCSARFARCCSTVLARLTVLALWVCRVVRLRNDFGRLRCDLLLLLFSARVRLRVRQVRRWRRGNDLVRRRRWHAYLRVARTAHP